MKEIVVFVISFLIPFVYYRSLSFLFRRIFDQPTKPSEGIQVHHLHYGVILLLVSAITLLFTEKNIYIIALDGLGLGLILDEFLGSLKFIEDRSVGLQIYRNSFFGTLILFLSISIILVLCGYLFIM